MRAFDTICGETAAGLVDANTTKSTMLLPFSIYGRHVVILHRFGALNKLETLLEGRIERRVEARRALAHQEVRAVSPFDMFCT